MRLLIVSFISIALCCCGTEKIYNYSSENTAISDSLAGNELDSLIYPYKKVVDATMNEVIGTAIIGLEKYDPESPLGNFAADVIYEAGLAYGRSTKDIGPDAMLTSFCLLNFGGLRAPINEGDITIGNIFQLMPFDNTLVLVRLKGEQVKELLQTVMASHGQPISGASMTLSGSSNSIIIGGIDYNFDQDVIVVTSDYLANGGDKMEFFKKSDRVWNSGVLMRDIFIDYVKKNKTIQDFPLEDRVVFNK